ncbi:MAG: type II toxin-antitoxin system Phd/YefM family antitoxin [Marmoricola sp.]
MFPGCEPLRLGNTRRGSTPRTATAALVVLAVASGCGGTSASPKRADPSSAAPVSLIQQNVPHATFDTPADWKGGDDGAHHVVGGSPVEDYAAYQNKDSSAGIEYQSFAPPAQAPSRTLIRQAIDQGLRAQQGLSKKQVLGIRETAGAGCLPDGPFSSRAAEDQADRQRRQPALRLHLHEPARADPGLLDHRLRLAGPQALGHRHRVDVGLGQAPGGDDGRGRLVRRHRQVVPGAIMCYMDRVGVRELRQNASKLLERVAAGESLVITNHGREVARLVPSPARPRTRADMIADGSLIPGRGDPRDFSPVKAPPGTPPSEQLLAELRDDR